MRWPALITAALVVSLVGCGSDDPPAATATSSSSSATTTTPSPAALGQADIYTCQEFVADQGPAYDWLTTLDRDGTVGSEAFVTPGYLEAYRLGGIASVFVESVEAPALRFPMETIVAEGTQLQEDIDGQATVADPSPLISALEDAAAACTAGGFSIDWA